MLSEITTLEEQLEVPGATSQSELNTGDELAVSQTSLVKALTHSMPESEQLLKAKISVLFDKLPRYVANFFQKDKKLLPTLGWILAAFASIKLTLAVLDAIDDIPFLTLLLELIGIGYVTWFICRYLLSAANRQELVEEIQAFKEQLLGSKNE